MLARAVSYYLVEGKATSALELTIGITAHHDHPPKLVHAQRGDLISIGWVVCASQDAALNDAVDTFVQQGHCWSSRYYIC